MYHEVYVIENFDAGQWWQALMFVGYANYSRTEYANKPRSEIFRVRRWRIAADGTYEDAFV